MESAAAETSTTADASAPETSTTADASAAAEAAATESSATAKPAESSSANAVRVPNRPGDATTGGVPRTVSRAEVTMVAATAITVTAVTAEAVSISKIRGLIRTPRRVETPAERVEEDAVAWDEG